MLFCFNKHRFFCNHHLKLIFLNFHLFNYKNKPFLSLICSLKSSSFLPNMWVSFSSSFPFYFSFFRPFSTKQSKKSTFQITQYRTFLFLCFIYLRLFVNILFSFFYTPSPTVFCCQLLSFVLRILNWSVPVF